MLGRLHAPGRRPRPGPGHRGDQQERGEPDLRRARRRGRGLPQPAARRRRRTRTCGSTRRTSRSARAGRVVSMAALVAVGVALTGERRVLGLELAAGNDEGTAWPRVHPGPRRARPPRRPPRHQRRPRGAGQGGPGAAPGRGLAALPGPLHPQRPGPRAARRRGAWSPRPSGSCSSSPTRPRPGSSSTGSSTGSGPRFAAVAELLADAEPDLLAHFAFPETHRRQIRSTNPLERLNKEIKRRTAVVGIFPNRASRHPPRRA